MSRAVAQVIVWASIVLAMACGSGPSAPSRPAGTPTSFGNMSIGPAVTPSDFARCLAGAGDQACFAARRLTASAATGSTVTSSPIDLAVTVSGSTVLLSWTAPSSQDSPVTSYTVEAGSSSGLANLANFNTGNAATSLTAPGVPAGTYYVRVRAVNAAGVSAASNEVIAVVGTGGCAGVPNAPTAFTAAVSGSTVTLAWSAPAGGCPPTTYVLEAGSAPGLANLANSSVGNTRTSPAHGVGAGTYYVRVRAANASGAGGASNEVVVVVGGGPAPTPPPPSGSGVFSGRWVSDVASNNGGYTRIDSCNTTAEERLDVQFDLTQNGSSVTGTLTTRVVVSNVPRPRAGCVPLVVGAVTTYAIAGTVRAGRGGVGSDLLTGTLNGQGSVFVTTNGSTLSGSLDDGGGFGQVGAFKR